MNPQTFYERLLIEIEHKGMKPSEFSNKVGFSRTSFYKFKKAYPTLENLIKIAEFLDVSIDYLLGRTTQRKIADDINNPLLERDPKLVEFLNYVNDRYLENNKD